MCIHVNVIVDRLVEIQPLSLVVTENWSKCKKENSRNFQQFGCILDETYHDSLKNNSKKYDCIGKFEPSKQNWLKYHLKWDFKKMHQFQINNNQI